MLVIALDGECTCSCHQADIYEVHVTACCEICPYCNKQIMVSMRARHECRCPQKPKDSPPTIDEPPETAA
ncbi:hypothetical protein IT408_03135 [Candidatus Uhrbacteria bacterium]|nr:hypothetical protein [Candidatus Uhrbacteria bacterium]